MGLTCRLLGHRYDHDGFGFDYCVRCAQPDPLIKMREAVEHAIAAAAPVTSYVYNPDLAVPEGTEPPEWAYVWDPANLDTAVAFRRTSEGVYEYHSTVRIMPLLWEGDQA